METDPVHLIRVDDLDGRMVRPEAQEDCGFLGSADPFMTLTEKFGESYAEYRRQWHAASSFELETTFPLQLDFELNYSCNLKCPMCTWSVEEDSGDDRMGWFPFEKYQEIVRYGVARGLRALDMSYVNEPLIRKDLPAFIAFARESGIQDVGFNTNGTLLTPEFSRLLIRSGLTRIQFSIDAFSSESFNKVRTGGDYHRVVQNVLDFLQIRKEMAWDIPLVAVSFVKQRDNEGELGPFVEFWEPKVDYLLVREYLTPVLPDSEHYDEKSKLFSEARHFAGEFRCTKPWQRMIVRHDGTLLPCCTFQGAFLPMGNVFQTPLEEVWRSQPMRELRALHKRGEFHKNPICKACALSSTVNYATWDR